MSDIQSGQTKVSRSGAVPDYLSRWFPFSRAEASTGITDIEWAYLEQEPLRARFLLRTALLAICALILWASVATVQEVTRGSGRVIPSTRLQIVQAVDGGVVEKIHVQPGMIVQAGQVLLQIDPTRFASNLQESASRFQFLLVRAERVKALLEQRPFNGRSLVPAEDPAIFENEWAAYQATLNQHEALVDGARQLATQRRQEIDEARVRRDQAKRTLVIVRRELELTRPLVANGAVSEVEILRLERDQSRLVGERDQAVAQVLRAQAAHAQAEQKINEIQGNFQSSLREELAETLSELEGLKQSSRTLQDKVDKAMVRSPVHGTVKRLLVTTTGAVVQPSASLLEVVPLGDALVLEAQIAPRDIAFLRPGQAAVVKFTAYDFAVYGGLDAIVDQIAADSVVDDDGQASYTVRVRTLQTAFGEGMEIIPGMVAEVDVITGENTFLGYLLKPVLRAKARAFSER